MGLGIILFCIGIFLLINGSKNYSQAVDKVRSDIKDDDVLYQQFITEEGITTYAEIIGMLLQQLEYDIKINNLEIDKSTHSPEKIQSYNIAKAEYKKEYLYDNRGNIYKIVFSKIN